jgi:hypothetical protein
MNLSASWGALFIVGFALFVELANELNITGGK